MLKLQILKYIFSILLFVNPLLNSLPVGNVGIHPSGEDPDTTKPVQYRRGIPLQEGYQSYEEKYSGKNLEEIKRSLFPLESTGTWTELNPKVPRVDYLGIHFVNKDTGWACGANGALIKTTNGGNSWKTINSQTTSPILKVKSYNSQIVIASGYDGLILRSIDGGETFTQVASGVTGDLWGLQMLNDTLGWACGNRNSLIKTTDNGLTWQILLTPGYTSDYWCIDFLNESYGFIAANGKVLKTTDGGNNWEIIQAGDTRSLYTIDAIDSLHIVAAGGPFGKNVYSSDGGFTWIQNANLIYENGVNSISFINADTGYAVGENWAIRKTENRGVTWWASAPVYSDWGLNLLEGGVGFASGGALRVYKTSNGYDNWKKLFIADNFSDVFFVNDNKGFIVVREPAKLYRTLNGGVSWDSVPGAPGGVDLLFIDSLTGFIASSNSKIYKTTDGGANWYITNINDTIGGVNKIFFINQTTGWAATEWSSNSKGKILKTTDGGENWFVQVQLLGSDSYTNIFFVDSLNGWATSRYIWQTTDGGTNWIQRTEIPINFANNIYFSNSDTGWIARGSSINTSFFKTTDGGNNWIDLPEIIGARSIYFFPDKSHLLITGSIIQNNVIAYKKYMTYDYGNTWIDISNDIPAGFSGFHAATNTAGYAVGSAGLIVHYMDTTYVPVEVISFTTKIETNEIIIAWITASELNNYGFEIQRSVDDKVWENIGFVAGHGTSTVTSHYQFIDPTINRREISYRLKQIDFDGTFTLSQIVIVHIENYPSAFSLYQNFPNPFNPNTEITFEIPYQSQVRIILYNITGQETKTIINRKYDAGFHSILLNANDLSSGIYFYRMTTDNGYTAIKKLTIMK
jgi:photosystem II stability/assembly factor-like uncharacterized protein